MDQMRNPPHARSRFPPRGLAAAITATNLDDGVAPPKIDRARSSRGRRRSARDTWDGRHPQTHTHHTHTHTHTHTPDEHTGRHKAEAHTHTHDRARTPTHSTHTHTHTAHTHTHTHTHTHGFHTHTHTHTSRAADARRQGRVRPAHGDRAARPRAAPRAARRRRRRQGPRPARRRGARALLPQGARHQDPAMDPADAPPSSRRSQAMRRPPRRGGVGARGRAHGDPSFEKDYGAARARTCWTSARTTLAPPPVLAHAARRAADLGRDRRSRSRGRPPSRRRVHAEIRSPTGHGKRRSVATAGAAFNATPGRARKLCRRRVGVHRAECYVDGQLAAGGPRQRAGARGRARRTRRRRAPRAGDLVRSEPDELRGGDAAFSRPRATSKAVPSSRAAVGAEAARGRARRRQSRRRSTSRRRELCVALFEDEVRAATRSSGVNGAANAGTNHERGSRSSRHRRRHAENDPITGLSAVAASDSPWRSRRSGSRMPPREATRRVEGKADAADVRVACAGPRSRRQRAGFALRVGLALPPWYGAASLSTKMRSRTIRLLTRGYARTSRPRSNRPAGRLAATAPDRRIDRPRRRERGGGGSRNDADGSFGGGSRRTARSRSARLPEDPAHAPDGEAIGELCAASGEPSAGGVVLGAAARPTSSAPTHAGRRAASGRATTRRSERPRRIVLLEAGGAASKTRSASITASRVAGEGAPPTEPPRDARAHDPTAVRKRAHGGHVRNQFGAARRLRPIRAAPFHVARSIASAPRRAGCASVGMRCCARRRSAIPRGLRTDALRRLAAHVAAATRGRTGAAPRRAHCWSRARWPERRPARATWAPRLDPGSRRSGAACGSRARSRRPKRRELVATARDAPRRRQCVFKGAAPDAPARRRRRRQLLEPRARAPPRRRAPASRCASPIARAARGACGGRRRRGAPRAARGVQDLGVPAAVQRVGLESGAPRVPRCRRRSRWPDAPHRPSVRTRRAVDPTSAAPAASRAPPRPSSVRRKRRRSLRSRAADARATQRTGHSPPRLERRRAPTVTKRSARLVPHSRPPRRSTFAERRGAGATRASKRAGALRRRAALSRAHAAYAGVRADRARCGRRDQPTGDRQPSLVATARASAARAPARRGRALLRPRRRGARKRSTSAARCAPRARTRSRRCSARLASRARRRRRRTRERAPQRARAVQRPAVACVRGRRRQTPAAVRRAARRSISGRLARASARGASTIDGAPRRAGRSAPAHGTLDRRRRHTRAAARRRRAATPTASRGAASNGGRCISVHARLAARAAARVGAAARCITDRVARANCAIVVRSSARGAHARQRGAARRAIAAARERVARVSRRILGAARLWKGVRGECAVVRACGRPCMPCRARTLRRCQTARRKTTRRPRHAQPSAQPRVRDGSRGRSALAPRRIQRVGRRVKRAK